MPLTLLDAPPPALTRAELATLSESTPATFEGIPPLLHHKLSKVQYSIEPAFESLSTGEVDLYVTEGALSIYSPSSSSGLLVPYPHLTLHAISRAPMRSTGSTSTSSDESVPTTTGGGPCIYCQVDSQVIESDADEMSGQTYELILIPEDPASLDKIFESLSSCAALHPPSGSADPSSLFGGLDPDSMVYADSDGNLVGPGMIETMSAEEERDLDSSAGRVAMEYLGSIGTNGNRASSSAPVSNGHTAETDEAEA